MSFRIAGLRRCSETLFAGVSVITLVSALLVGCSVSSTLQAITVSPAPGVETLNGAGQTFQYKATGLFQQGKHPATSEDITNSVTWTSNNTAIATVSSTGLVTSVGPGTATITASTTTSGGGQISGSSTVTVAAGSGTSASRSLQSITIYPNSQTFNSVGETSQYIAIGTYTGGSPATQDLTSLVTWGSSDTNVARVDATGLATAVSASNSTTITALYTPPTSSTNPNPATIIGTATFAHADGGTTSTLPTLAIYKVGESASLGTVTATYTLPGSTTAVTLTCGPGASVAECTMNLPGSLSSTSPLKVTVTTPNKTSAPTFGGWSSDCVLANSNDPFTCTYTYSVSASTSLKNVSVGAIFVKP